MKRIGDVLALSRQKIGIDPGADYKQIGVYSWGKGLIKRHGQPGASLSKLTYYKLTKNALILSNIQAWEAAIAVSDDSADEYIASQRFLPYVPIDSDVVSVDYVLQYLLSDIGLASVRKASPGSVTRNRTLGIAAFENIEIPLPDITEQRRIVEQIDRYVSQANLLASSNEQWRISSASLHQRLVESDAQLCQIDELLDLQRRKVTVDPKRIYQEIGLRSFGRGVFHKSPLPGHELGTKKVFEISPGDLLISSVFAWEGAVAIAGDQEQGMIGSHRFMTWTPRIPEVDVNYLATFFTSEAGIKMLQSASPGSAGRNKTLSISAFKNLRIPVPSHSDQLQISRTMGMQQKLSTLYADRAEIGQALPKSVRNEIFSKLF